MKQLTSWLKTAVTSFLDPDREARVEGLVKAIQRGIQTQGPQFILESALVRREFSPDDLAEAKRRYYRTALERAWKDGELSTSEQKIAAWLALRLKLPDDEKTAIDHEMARQVFAVALAQSMEDGVLTTQEEARLKKITDAVGCDVSDFMRAFFQKEGEAFLRSMFLTCIEGNRLSQAAWSRLMQVARRFGLQQNEMLDVLEPQGRQFVEHILADAKSDGRLSPQENQTLAWMVENLHLTPDFQAYVLAEVRQLQVLTEIEDGRLPSIEMPTGMERRAGEIVHWVGYTTWREQRRRKDGIHTLDHRGVLAMTDNRMIFSADAKSHTTNYRKIVSHSGCMGWVQVQVEGKPANLYLFYDSDPVPYAVFRNAVAMANQTKLARLEGSNTRHIPREVRQRVWQRYGGRCAECAATNYLEFDHIIPFAKGGSNTDANVQLLCRGCNSKKSDAI